MKKCKTCKKLFVETQFYKHPTSKFGRVLICKQCIASDLRRRRADKKRFLLDLAGGKCTRCGYNKCTEALEFDHQPGEKKEFAIADVRSLERLKLEIKKCRLLCANCHREVTVERKASSFNGKDATLST